MNFGTITDKINWYLYIKEITDEKKLSEIQTYHIINTHKPSTMNNKPLFLEHIEKIKKSSDKLLENLALLEIFSRRSGKNNDDISTLIFYNKHNTKKTDIIALLTSDHINLLVKNFNALGSICTDEIEAYLDKEINTIARLPSLNAVIAQCFGSCFNIFRPPSKISLSNIFRSKLFYEFREKFNAIFIYEICKIKPYLQNQHVYNYLRHHMLKTKDEAGYKEIFDSLLKLSEQANLTAAISDEQNIKDNTSSHKLF